MTITAPGRVCLFGDHQDYLKLPVIACAINKRVLLSATKNNTNTLHLFMPDIHKERIIANNESFEYLEPGDHLGAAIKVLRRYGCIPSEGYNITVQSDIPINAGLSSSSAILVAWIHFLLKAFGCDRPITEQFIAQIAYEAEVKEHNSPGGRMDQYTIAIGDVLYLNTREEDSFERIGTQLEGLVVGVSGIGKNTTGVLGSVRANAEKAIAQVQTKDPSFDLYTAKRTQIQQYAPTISEALHPYFYAALENHCITLEALEAFKKDTIDYRLIGKLMYQHHCVLRDQLRITVPLIDTMIDAAMEAGAYGAKIVGSGMGGCITALTTNKNQEKVIQAIKQAGAQDAYVVKVAKGTQCHD